ncbi:sulfotransferase domain-containing protein [Formosa sediminum]|uniref:Sulfotransferase domain-containing protein n=1 Tax=Formosa sediminum TaxID=2594004 RepID=A0A516GQ73_9FLAO|nr:sulfotransferase domain-containing protein [Formosa sediminum]QDO93678.1 sulfotransferase domain-containing protein [Formosa sediminum]
MKLINILNLLKNPKRYIGNLVDSKTNSVITKIIDDEFLEEIDTTKVDDVFIVGFPKSGNTWMQSLMAGVLYGIDTEFMPDKLAQEIVPDVHARKYYKRFGVINFFKTHHLPKPNYKKVIYLVRDGRDAMVSYYHFNKNLGVDVTLEEMVKYGKNVYPAKWVEHVNSWQKNPYNADILIIRYEDLLNQPLIELNKICSFVNIERSEELLNKVIVGNEIDKMRKRVKQTGGLGNKMWEGDKGVKFFRKGKSGSYKSEMPLELISYFNEESSSALKLFNYDV